LLTVQVAITVLLLACSGATLRKLEQLIHGSFGCDPRHLFAVNNTLSEGDHHTWAERVHYSEKIRQTVAADPGVGSASIAFASLPPLIVEGAVSVPGSAVTGGNVVPARVGRNYFWTLRIPMLNGRTWIEDEIVHAAHLAVINETMKQLCWPHTDLIGQTVVLNNRHGPR
jgi:hypothetical protein